MTKTRKRYFFLTPWIAESSVLDVLKKKNAITKEFIKENLTSMQIKCMLLSNGHASEIKLKCAKCKHNH